MKKIAGFTLFESVWALALGSIILLIFLKAFLGLAQELSRFDAEQELDQKANEFALILENSIQESGFMGCGNSKTLEFNKEVLPPEARFVGAKIVDGNTLWLAFSFAPIAVLAQDHDKVTLAKSLPDLKKQSLAIFGSCDQKIISRVQKFYFPYVYLENLPHIKSHYLEMALWQYQVFDWEDTHRVDAHHHPIYGLYEKVNGGERMELIDDVTDFMLQRTGDVISVKFTLSSEKINFQKTYRLMAISQFDVSEGVLPPLHPTHARPCAWAGSPRRCHPLI